MVAGIDVAIGIYIVFNIDMAADIYEAVVVNVSMCKFMLMWQLLIGVVKLDMAV